MTADSLGHYNINDQTPRPGGAITISGSIMSLTPNKSDILVATHTGNLGANFSTGFASGPKVTGVRTFEGNALGARHGLCSSSMLTLIGIAILLWFQ